MEIPTEDDWQLQPDDLDGAWAYKNFHDKSFDEAVCLFEENALRYQEDLLYMPDLVFHFYLPAYIAYLFSDASKGESDAASCFIHLIRFKSEHDREAIVPVWSAIEPLLKHLVEHQDTYEADWAIYGCFRSLVHEIVERGFEVTFDTSAPEIVPESVSIGDVAYPARTTSWPVALQLFHHTGIDQVEADSRKPDILRIFGPPDASGGGDHPRFGFIPDWIIYHRLFFTIRFEFDGDSIASVSFLPPKGSSGLPPEVEKVLSPENRELLAQYFGAPPMTGNEDPAVRSRLDVFKRFESLWRDIE